MHRIILVRLVSIESVLNQSDDIRLNTYTELRRVTGGEIPLGKGIWAVSTGSNAFTVANSISTH